MKRGEIWWASMAEPHGSEPGYRRPVVIVSANAFNESNIQTVIVVITPQCQVLIKIKSKKSTDHDNL